MMRFLAAVICLGLGGPAMAEMPSDGPRLEREAPRMERTREDVADLWLRESAPRPTAGR
ncbi:hypothetical protein [Falsirhodobacter sp. 20TX0035]|uniref:hypothetical protein n=1 Tax=Falsirhodobacter sp. 20TX0035 TaxID=3022019 RepID=UPI00232B7710|nr:hypothetical protein [Falsirhodobacter sp. 20TX0035]MDB6452457.1 hypothetical protein [Falsirhodobacter sp. 20TX0035]